MLRPLHLACGLIAGTLALVPTLTPTVLRAQAAKQPVYVGARACAQCHEGKAAGNQYSHWLLSAHSKAWATLATPEAGIMARLSGISDDPQQAPICLGCHATGSEAENWEKDPGFRVEDGVQCEKCHGPGSEYMDERVMRDPEAARRAGLRRLTRRDCAVCHYVKGSHAAVLRRPQLDVDAAWQALAHRVPDEGRQRTLAHTTSSDPRANDVDACGACHQGAKMGNALSLWQLSPHARASAVLSTPAAAQVAKDMGLTADPQSAETCLLCHATADRRSASHQRTYDASEGVSCAACHLADAAEISKGHGAAGPDPAHVPLRPVSERTCGECHTGPHARPLDFASATRQIAHPIEIRTLAGAIGEHTALAPQTAGQTLDEQYGMAGSKGARWLLEEFSGKYKNPVSLAFRPGGREVWTACEASATVVVIDAATRAKVADVQVGGQPTDVAFSPDGTRAYVSNRLDDSVSIIDTQSRAVLQVVKVGDEPHGLLTDRTGQTLYVLNSSSADLSVIDLATGRQVRRLSTSRYPWSLSLSPDGSRLLVTNALSRLGRFRTAPVSEITVVDPEASQVADRRPVPEANLMLGVAWHPSGDFALATLNRTKNLVPMTRVLQGWTITNGLAIVWKDGRVDQVLLDEPQRYFADVTDVAFTPDGTRALVTSAGTDLVAVIDVAKLLALLARTPEQDRKDVLPNWLGASSEFVVARVPVRDNPRGVAVAPDGATAWVANTLDDSISVIDLSRNEAVARVDLGGPTTVTHVRWGEQLFHSAKITFQKQFACATCHPDGHVDGLTYDIEADGIGVSPVDNRTLRGIYDTDPFKWEGTNPTLARQCGARLAIFFTRLAPFTPEQLRAVNDYTVTIPRPPNRHRPLGAQLTAAQQRGKVVFERHRAADGREIPPEGRCAYCHFGPYFTDRQQRDVGTRHASDRQGKFDVPHLNNIYDSAPYLHDGSANTLEEIWTVHNPHDTHGYTNDLTKDQLNDLIEYLKTL